MLRNNDPTTIVGWEFEKSTRRHRLSVGEKCREGKFGARMSGQGGRKRERELPLKNWDAGKRELGSDRGVSAFLTPSFSRFFPLPSCFTALSRNGVTFATAMPRLSNRVKEDPVRGGLRERERERKGREDVGRRRLGLEMARVAASTKLQGVLTYGQPRAASSSRLNHPRSFVRRILLPPPPRSPLSISRVRTFSPSIQDVTHPPYLRISSPSFAPFR